MNEKKQFTKRSQTVELNEAQEAFKKLVNARKMELRNKYFDFINGLKVTVTGAGDSKIRLSYNVNGLSAKGVTNCNFYLDWDDNNLAFLVPQIHDELGITELEEVPCVDLSELFSE